MKNSEDTKYIQRSINEFIVSYGKRQCIIPVPKPKPNFVQTSILKYAIVMQQSTI